MIGRREGRKHLGKNGMRALSKLMPWKRYFGRLSHLQLNQLHESLSGGCRCEVKRARKRGKSKAI